MASAARTSAHGHDEEAAPLLSESDSGRVPSRERARRRMEPRAAATAVVTLCLFLLAVSGLSVRRVLLPGTFGFGGAPVGNLCTFAQLQRGLTMRHAGAEPGGAGGDPAVARDTNSVDGLFFSAPGAALPMSGAFQNDGFACDATYAEWLRHSALYTPDSCALLTPPWARSRSRPARRS